MIPAETIEVTIDVPIEMAIERIPRKTKAPSEIAQMKAIAFWLCAGVRRCIARTILERLDG
jgi:hypothetical protein